jgi:quinol monooxygenase YgiN
MVIRVWIYRVSSDKAQQFEEFERQVGMSMISSHPGCLRVEFFKRYDEENASEQAGQVEFTMISKWESREQLEAALATNEWKEEVKLFRSKQFSDIPGVTRHYEQVA